MKDIHFDGTIGTIVDSGADTYIQHAHISFSVECNPYGVDSVCGNQFVRIVHA